MNDNLDQNCDTQGAAGGANSVAGTATPDAGASRRQFTRQALTGSAILFSLANRPVWSQTTNDCVSVGFLNSVGFSSLSPELQDAKIADTTRQIEELEKRAADRGMTTQEQNPGTTEAEVCIVPAPNGNVPPF